MLDFNTAIRLDDDGHPITGSWVYPPTESPGPDPADAFASDMAEHKKETTMQAPENLIAKTPAFNA